MAVFYAKKRGGELWQETDINQAKPGQSERPW